MLCTFFSPQSFTDLHGVLHGVMVRKPYAVRHMPQTPNLLFPIPLFNLDSIKVWKLDKSTLFVCITIHYSSLRL